MGSTPHQPETHRGRPMKQILNRLLLTLLLGLMLAAPAGAAPADKALQQRLAAWPAWRLPAPVERPGRSDLIYPDWFAGQWRVHSHDDPEREGASTELTYCVRFQRDAQGRVVGDRAFNASAVGRAALGERLLRVRNDPRNPNRQIALLAGGLQLESTVIGRRQATPDADTLLAAELSLQVLHRSVDADAEGRDDSGGDPRISRVETLSRYRRLDDGRIIGEQWQASYGSPADGLIAGAQRSWHGTLDLEQEPD